MKISPYAQAFNIVFAPRPSPPTGPFAAFLAETEMGSQAGPDPSGSDLETMGGAQSIAAPSQALESPRRFDETGLLESLPAGQAAPTVAQVAAVLLKPQTMEAAEAGPAQFAAAPPPLGAARAEALRLGAERARPAPLWSVMASGESRSPGAFPAPAPGGPPAAKPSEHEVGDVEPAPERAGRAPDPADPSPLNVVLQDAASGLDILLAAPGLTEADLQDFRRRAQALPGLGGEALRDIHLNGRLLSSGQATSEGALHGCQRR